MAILKKSVQCNVQMLIKYFTIVTILSFFGGCTPYHYVSSPQYVPLHDKKLFTSDFMIFNPKHKSAVMTASILMIGIFRAERLQIYPLLNPEFFFALV